MSGSLCLWLFSAGVLWLTLTPVSHAEILRTTPIRDLEYSVAPLPPLSFWRQTDDPGHYVLCRIGPKGDIRRSPKKVVPRFDPHAASAGIFWPDNDNSGSDLIESKEVPSPDGRWVVKTHGIKTFADDLKNAYLVVADKTKGLTSKVQIPTNSMGTLWPLFWHPKGRLFYFMVMKGEVRSRTFGLWQYDAEKRSFRNIGTTDGRAFLSPDGDWLVWETGLLADECDTSMIHKDIHLVAYHIPDDVNYRLTAGGTKDLFHDWDRKESAKPRMVK